jgi:hypothetical protein
VGSAPAAAALPTCTANIPRNVVLYPFQTLRVYVPSYWNGSTSTTTCRLGLGDHDNNAVLVLQGVLRTCYNQNIAADLDFGSGTRTALMNARTWERVAYGRPVSTDGVYGPQTRDNLRFPAAYNGGVICIRLDGTIA